jgi:DNA-binding XRE family transcriptional regulator
MSLRPGSNSAPPSPKQIAGNAWRPVSGESVPRRSDPLGRAAISLGSIATELERARVEASRAREDVARAAAVRRQTYTSVVEGMSWPSSYTLARLAETLGLRLVVAPASESHEAVASPDPKVEPLIRPSGTCEDPLIAIVGSLTHKQRDILLRLAQHFVEANEA